MGLAQFRRRACRNLQRLSKATLIAMFSEGSRTREFFEKLEDDEWSIDSFNPDTREVCVKLETPSGERKVAVTLPILSVSGIKNDTADA